jgi:hypothetical protein
MPPPALCLSFLPAQPQPAPPLGAYGLPHPQAWPRTRQSVQPGDPSTRKAVWEWAQDKVNTGCIPHCAVQRQLASWNAGRPTLGNDGPFVIFTQPSRMQETEHAA